MSIPVINFPPFRPYSNITPFTVRDGATYLTVLEELRNWLNSALVPHVDTEIANLVTSWEDNANTLLANVIAALSTNLADVQAAIDEVINNSITVQDPVVAELLNKLDSQTRAALDALLLSVIVEDENDPGTFLTYIPVVPPNEPGINPDPTDPGFFV